MLFNRYMPLAFSAIATIVLTALLPNLWAGVFLLGAAILAILGAYDCIQTSHSVRRNYPIVGRLRWLFESIRPGVRQYLIEDDQEQTPFSRSQRSLVYTRAKNEVSERPFGTLVDVYQNGYEFIAHSTRPLPAADPKTFRILIGDSDCAQQYSASIFNISAMSFGALSANAIRALNKGAELGGFAHDTGEGSISRYHLEHDGDLIWEIGSGYFGCRKADGSFDPVRFAEQAGNAQVKMIEIKISQGAKPGMGGILPAAKISTEIAETRGIPLGEDCISPARHSSFSTPLELCRFIGELRNLSEGKPVGFKLCVGQPWEFMGMVKAMLETNILPDYIVVDGGEGGTGAAPLEFTDHLGMPMREGLLFVHNTLVGAGLRGRIKVGAAGKIISAFDIATVMALGADWTNAGRGFMFAIGCIQSLACHTNRCPAGVATQDAIRQRGLDVLDKSDRVFNYHRNTLAALAEMTASAGLDHPSKLSPHHLVRRVSLTEIRLFSQLHIFLNEGELLSGASERDFYSAAWDLARSDSFELMT